MFGFDPLYFLFLAPGILLAMWAQWRVKSAYAEGSQVLSHSGYSGAQTAAYLLRHGGINNVQVEPVEGFLTDHYSPGEKVLRLSPEVFQGQSLAALGIAAHETGHAYQDAYRYPLLVVRNGLVPLAGLGGNVSMLLIILGFGLAAGQSSLGGTLLLLGIGAFSLTVLFQVVNLPVEFDASRRARKALLETGLVSQEEDQVVAKVLNAAALTYVAGTLTSVLTLLYLLVRSGLLGGHSQRDE